MAPGAVHTCICPCRGGIRRIGQSLVVATGKAAALLNGPVGMGSRHVAGRLHVAGRIVAIHDLVGNRRAEVCPMSPLRRRLPMAGGAGHRGTAPGLGCAVMTGHIGAVPQSPQRNIRVNGETDATAVSPSLDSGQHVHIPVEMAKSRISVNRLGRDVAVADFTRHA